VEYQPYRPPDAFQPGMNVGTPPLDPTETLAQLEATVGGLEADLIACHKLALLGSLSAIVVHEIKNLMTPVLARAELALSTGAPADMQKALDRTCVHVQRAISVTERLLAVAKSREQPLESCSVAAAVREAVETATRPFEKDGIELRVSVADDLRVGAHRDLLEQVLLNLLLNAREAMKGLRGKLAINARRDGACVIIDVCDSGSGIPAERLEHVINPFFAIPEHAQPHAWQAVGLGLNACRIIARRHGATLEALANPERGCTFRLRWPAG
jgi:signal transduction histidine kinase